MIGYNVMKTLRWPVMWKSLPACKRLRDVWLRALTSGRGLDTTGKSLKLCIPSDVCRLEGAKLSNELLFAGYVSGSTLGGGSLLLAWMLLEVSRERSPWEVPEVVAFMKSIARIKTVFVIYDNPMERAADAWRTRLANVFICSLPTSLPPSFSDALVGTVDQHQHGGLEPHGPGGTSTGWGDQQRPRTGAGWGTNTGKAATNRRWLGDQHSTNGSGLGTSTRKEATNQRGRGDQHQKTGHESARAGEKHRKGGHEPARTRGTRTSTGKEATNRRN